MSHAWTEAHGALMSGDRRYSPPRQRDSADREMPCDRNRHVVRDAFCGRDRSRDLARGVIEFRAAREKSSEARARLRDRATIRWIRALARRSMRKQPVQSWRLRSRPSIESRTPHSRSAAHRRQGLPREWQRQAITASPVAHPLRAFRRLMATRRRRGVSGERDDSEQAEPDAVHRPWSPGWSDRGAARSSRFPNGFTRPCGSRASILDLAPRGTNHEKSSDLRCAYHRVCSRRHPAIDSRARPRSRPGRRSHAGSGVLRRRGRRMHDPGKRESADGRHG